MIPSLISLAGEMAPRYQTKMFEFRLTKMPLVEMKSMLAKVRISRTGFNPSIIIPKK